MLQLISSRPDTVRQGPRGGENQVELEASGGAVFKECSQCAVFQRLLVVVARHLDSAQASWGYAIVSGEPLSWIDGFVDADLLVVPAPP